MPLPDSTRLHQLPAGDWFSLGRHLKDLGYTSKATWPIHKLVSEAMSPLRAPLAKWHARRVRDLWGAAVRMLMLNDPVTEAEAQAALGNAVSLDRLLDVGLLARHPSGGVASPFVMDFSSGCLFLCDDLTAGGDTVMGPGGSTADLVRGSYPTIRGHSMLDLGCGAGSVAVILSPCFERVVATDINPRALTLARVNAWMNGIQNIEFRQGDLFSPLAGETFDLLVSQPPFVAQPDGAPSATFLYGGHRGDELPIRVLSGLPAHLAPGGVAVLFVEWPVCDGDSPLEGRAREALSAPDASLLIIRMEDLDYLDAHCAHYATLNHPALDGLWEDAIIRRRDHLEKMRVHHLRPTLTVVQRPANGIPPWTSVVQSQTFLQSSFTRARLDAILAARDLEAKGPSAVESSRLRIPDDVTILKGAKGGFIAAFAEEGRAPMPVENATAKLVKLVDTAPSVADALARLVGRKRGWKAARANALVRVTQALLQGLLEVASRGR